MLARPTTLLAIFPDFIARANFRAAKLGEGQTAPRPGGGELADLVEAAVRLSPGKLGKTWIVTTDLWSQVMSIPAEVAMRVSKPQLARFLSFEAEPLSGVSPQDAAAAAAPIRIDSQESVYWFIELEQQIYRQIEEIVEARGGKLAGILHPAALPAPVQKPVGQAWQRLELWPDLAVCLHGVGRRAPRMKILPGSLATAGSDAEMARWFADQGPAAERELLIAGAGWFDPDGDWQPSSAPLSLADRETFANWSQGWMRHLPAPGVPAIRPQAKPLSAGTKKALIGAAFGLTCLGCFVHWNMATESNRQEKQKLTADIARDTAPTMAFGKVRADIAKLEKELKATEGEVELLEGQTATTERQIARQRERMARLLAAVAVHRSPQLVIHEIVENNGELKLGGRCLETRDANRLASALSTTLGPYGLSISLPAFKALYLRADGSPYEFELTIQDNGRPGG